MFDTKNLCLFQKQLLSDPKKAIAWWDAFRKDATLEFGYNLLTYTGGLWLVELYPKPVDIHIINGICIKLPRVPNTVYGSGRKYKYNYIRPMYCLSYSTRIDFGESLKPGGGAFTESPLLNLLNKE